jgi:hypothetical protein
VVDPSPILTRDLARLGFREVDPEVAQRVVVATMAPEKSGKTHWAFTAPGPIGAISTDTGTEEIAKRFLGSKRILMCPFRSADDIRLAGEGKKQAEQEWKKMKDAIEGVIANPHFRTLIIDTATEAWELCRLAAFGKLTQVMPHHYVEVNAEFRALIKQAYERKDLNAIFIHKVKKEYKTNREGKDVWSGRWERSGFGDMPYLVDCNVRNYFDRESKEFGIEILDSRMEMSSAVGTQLTGDLCSFEMLAETLFPDTQGTGYWQ